MAIIMADKNYVWKDFSSMVSEYFASQRYQSNYFDIDLVCDDMQIVPAHQLVLSASSEYFKSILTSFDDSSRPMIILNGVSSCELQGLLDFMYFGSVKLPQESWDSYLNVAQSLKLHGLLPENQTINCNQLQGLQTENQNIDFNLEPKIEVIQKNEDNVNDQEISSYGTDVPTTPQSGIIKKEKVVKELDPEFQELKQMSADHFEMNKDGKFECNFCGKTTKLKMTMQYHIETHLDGLSYECPMCGRHFRSKNSQRVHISMKHSNKGEPFPDVSSECPICGKYFKNKNSQRAHASNYHKNSQNV